jgi:hypothetical protein
MKTYTKTWEDEIVDPNYIYYKIDQKKLVKWLKHLKQLNGFLKDDLSRDDVQRGRDEGRFDAYACLLGDINRGTIFMKSKK